MFGKKKIKMLEKENAELKQKIVELSKPVDLIPQYYSAWEQDFGFLTLILTRNINMHKVFFIEPYIKQLDGSGTIKEEEITASIEDIIEAVFSSLSDTYIDFLVKKYFKDQSELLDFISDEVYVEVLKNATDANRAKLNKVYQKNFVKKINTLNNLNKEKKEDK